MLHLLIGFIVGFLFCVIAGHYGLKIAEKRGHYASAIYDEDKDVWTVRGRFLCIAGKIGNRLKHENGEGVKYK